MSSFQKRSPRHNTSRTTTTPNHPPRLPSSRFKKSSNRRYSVSPKTTYRNNQHRALNHLPNSLSSPHSIVSFHSPLQKRSIANTSRPTFSSVNPPSHSIKNKTPTIIQIPEIPKTFTQLQPLNQPQNTLSPQIRLIPHPNPFPTTKKMAHSPPVERPPPRLSAEQVIDTIQWEKLQYNPNFLDLEPVILVASGSFSPISTLHVQMMTMIREALMIKQRKAHVLGGILSPVSDGYGKASLIDENHRYEMCRLATEDVSWLGVSKVEIAQRKWIETRLVFDQLQDAFDLQFSKMVGSTGSSPEGLQAKEESQKTSSHISQLSSQPSSLPTPIRSPRMIFCMGSDVFLGFHKSEWWSPVDIEIYCTKYRLAVVMRESDHADVQELLETHEVLKKYRDNSIFIITPNYTNSISSTLIRNQINCDGSLYGLVNHKVDNYMKDNKLYGYGKCNTNGGTDSRCIGGEGQYKPLFSATTITNPADNTPTTPPPQKND